MGIQSPCQEQEKNQVIFVELELAEQLADDLALKEEAEEELLSLDVPSLPANSVTAAKSLVEAQVEIVDPPEGESLLDMEASVETVETVGTGQANKGLEQAVKAKAMAPDTKRSVAAKDEADAADASQPGRDTAEPVEAKETKDPILDGKAVNSDAGSQKEVQLPKDAPPAKTQEGSVEGLRADES